MARKIEGKSRPAGRLFLSDMFVIVDVVDAVAIEAAAFGAVTEFQIGVLRIGSSADGAFVAVSRLGIFLLIGGRPVCVGFGSGGTGRIVFEKVRQNVSDVFPEEKDVVQQRDDRCKPQEIERAVTEKLQNVENGKAEIDPRHPLHPDRKNEEQKHLRFRCDGGNGKEQTQVQIGRRAAPAEDQRENVVEKDAGQVVEIEPETAPDLFKDLAELVVAEKRNRCQKEADALCVKKICEYISKQPPDLTSQNGTAGETKERIDNTARVNGRKKIGYQIADGDDEHQIADALVSVFQTPSVKAFAKLLHLYHPPKLHLFYRINAGKSINKM